VGRNPKETHT